MKKREVGEKRPLSHGYTVDHEAQAKASADIQSQTEVFLSQGGKIQYVESNVMQDVKKGSTALRINHDK